MRATRSEDIRCGTNRAVEVSAAAHTKGPPPRETRTITVDNDLYALEADAFAATVFDGVAPPVSRDDTLGNQRVIDELRHQIGAKV